MRSRSFTPGLKLILAVVALFFVGIKLGAAQDFKAIADSNNAFAFDLFKTLGADEADNLLFSPFSISTALAMTYAGARGETEREMSRTLHFDTDQSSFHPAYKAYLDTIKLNMDGKTQLYLYNKIWVQTYYTFNQNYLAILVLDYNSKFNRVNFTWPDTKKNAEREINDQVEQATNGQIKDIIAPTLTNKTTRLLLVSAIYFNGNWSEPFNKKLTKEGDFFPSPNEKVRAMFMQKESHFNFYEDRKLKAIELPYKGNRLSMMIFLPKDSVFLKKRSINSDYYKMITTSLNEQYVSLTMPKFKISNRFDPSIQLASMGMFAPFTDSADFSGITENNAKPQVPLKISNIIHQSVLEVSENGTETTAPTAINMAEVTSMKPLPIIFKVDHPFFFIIRDRTSGAILFMGIVTKPFEG